MELFYYPNRPNNVPLDDSDMYEKAIELYNISGNVMNLKLCIERFPKFRDKLEAYIENHNSNIGG